MLELFVILEHFHDSFHVWLAVGRLVVFTFHKLLDLIGIIPVFVLHEEAQVDEYKCWATNNTTCTVNKYTPLAILNHFVKFQGSLEKLFINILIPITDRIVNKFNDAMVSVELFQFGLVDSS